MSFIDFSSVSGKVAGLRGPSKITVRSIYISLENPDSSLNIVLSDNDFMGVLKLELVV